MSIGVIGCGYWGKNHIKTLNELGLLTAIADYDNFKAKNLADLYSCNHSTVEEILLNKDIQGIVIATNAKTHFSLAIKSILNRKNVFIEKPLAMSSKEAEELRKILDKNKLIGMVGHLLNFHPGYKKVQQLISDNIIGKIFSIKTRRMSMGQIRKEEDVLWSFAPHDIAIILGLTKDHDFKILNTSSKRIISNIKDDCYVYFKLPNSNIHCEIQVSWFHPYKEHKLFIIGEYGSIVFDDTLEWNRKIAIYKHTISPELQKGDIEYIPIEKKFPLTEELLYFYNCITNNITPMISNIQEGIKVIKIIEDIENYGTTGKE